MTTALSLDDEQLLDQASRLLDTVGRRSPRCTVALHAFAAAQLLAAVHAVHADPATDYADERVALHQSLQLLAHLSTAALRSEDIADAMHHALLAYLAAG
jgi:hypothetical protein